MQYISRISKDKREQATVEHLTECAEYAERLGRKFDIQTITRISALFHDIGKFSDEFVEYLKSKNKDEEMTGQPMKKGTVIHSTQGAKFLYEAQFSTDNLIANLVKEVTAICIANHHGGLMDGISPIGNTPFRDRVVYEKEKFHYEEVKNAVNKAGLTDGLQIMFKKGTGELGKFIKKCKDNKLNCTSSRRCA